MGKKSRGKRERRDGQEIPLGDFLMAGVLRDDPAGLREIAALHGRAWLLSRLPNAPLPFPFALAELKAARCLAAYIDLAAQETRSRLDDEERKGVTQAVIWLGRGFFALSTLAFVLSKNGLPHPADEIRAAIGSVFDHLRDEEAIFDGIRNRVDPSLQDDWGFVARERLADEETADLLRAIGDAGLPKEGEPQAEKDPGGL